MNSLNLILRKYFPITIHPILHKICPLDCGKHQKIQKKIFFTILSGRPAQLILHSTIRYFSKVNFSIRKEQGKKITMKKISLRRSILALSNFNPLWLKIHYLSLKLNKKATNLVYITRRIFQPVNALIVVKLMFWQLCAVANQWYIVVGTVS